MEMLEMFVEMMGMVVGMGGEGGNGSSGIEMMVLVEVVGMGGDGNGGADSRLLRRFPFTASIFWIA